MLMQQTSGLLSKDEKKVYVMSGEKKNAACQAAESQDVSRSGTKRMERTGKERQPHGSERGSPVPLGEEKCKPEGNRKIEF